MNEYNPIPIPIMFTCLDKAIKLIPFVFFSFMIFFQLRGQDKKKIDSLTSVLNSSLNDENLMLTQISLAYEYFDFDNQKALDYSSEAYKLACKLGDTVSIVKAGRIRGQMLRRGNNLNESIVLLSYLEPIAKRNALENDYVRILNALAVAYTFTAEYDKALNYNIQCLMVRESHGSTSEISISLNNIGVIYFKLNNYKKALEFYQQALELKKRINDTSALDGLFLNSGLCYNQLGDSVKALECFNKAFKECGDSCSDAVIVEGEFGYGELYFKLGKLKEAQEHFRKSYSKAKENDDKRFLAENVLMFSRIYLQRKKYDSALTLLSTAEKTASESGYNDILINTYSELSKLHSHFKDFKKTAYYQSKYITLRDSIYSQELTQNLMAVQAEYEQRENKAKIESQNKLLVLKEEIITKQQWLNILAVATVLLLVAFVITLFRNNQQKKKTNRLLELKVQERTKELSQSYQLIEKAYADQTHLIVKTSSDIKSPLSTMKGLCSLALQEIEDPSAKEYVIQMDATTAHLSEMVNKLSVR